MAAVMVRSPAAAMARAEAMGRVEVTETVAAATAKEAKVMETARAMAAVVMATVLAAAMAPLVMRAHTHITRR